MNGAMEDGRDGVKGGCCVEESFEGGGGGGGGEFRHRGLCNTSYLILSLRISISNVFILLTTDRLPH